MLLLLVRSRCAAASAWLSSRSACACPSRAAPLVSSSPLPAPPRPCLRSGLGFGVCLGLRSSLCAAGCRRLSVPAREGEKPTPFSRRGWSRPVAASRILKNISLCFASQLLKTWLKFLKIFGVFHVVFREIFSSLSRVARLESFGLMFAFFAHFR